MQILSDKIIDAVNLLRNEELNTDDGMPEELFLLISSLIPIANVDLLVTNDSNQILLARRNDRYYEKSWHIPGGCLRYMERMEERLQKTAELELGPELAAKVRFDLNPVTVRELLRGPNQGQPHPRERGHNISILFRGHIDGPAAPGNSGLTPEDNGYLKWFDRLPDDFLGVQRVYSDILLPWENNGQF